MRQALLALLVAHAGRPLSRSALVEALWGEDPPERAINVVHKHVGALRRAVDPDLPRRATGNWLRSDPSGYYIDGGAAQLDVLDFRSLLSESSAVASASSKLDLLLAALDRWRGAAGESLAVEHRAHPVFEALNREHATAAVAAAELALRLGRADEVIVPLELAAANNPTDELVHAQLVLALATTGRRSKALELFRAIRHRLVDGLGVEPSSALQDAQLAILRDELPMASPSTSAPAQLPVGVVDFVTRERELDHVLTRLGGDGRAPGASVVCISGPPGIGKSALALHVAQRLTPEFVDGQLFVDLRGHDPTQPPRDSNEVLADFLDALGVQPARVPDGIDQRSALMRSLLARRRVLLVLDNAINAEQVRPLLPGSGGSVALVTSRSALHGLTAAGASTVVLRHLDETDSARLLEARLGAKRVREEPDAVATLLHAAGGLPLALALMAARVHEFPGASLSALAHEMRSSSRRLNVLIDPADATTDLRGVMSWSYNRLSRPASQLFRLLSLHPGDVMYESPARALLGAEDREAGILLHELREAGLITLEGSGQFRMHDLVKSYATELMDERAGMERIAAESRLFEWASDIAVAAAAAVSPARTGARETAIRTAVVFDDPSEAMAWLEDTHQLLVDLMVRGAATPRQDRSLWRIGWSLHHYLDTTGRWKDLVRTQMIAVEAADRSASEPVRAHAHRGLGRALLNVGRLQEAQAQVELALALTPDDPTARDGDFVAETHRLLSYVHEQSGQLAEALTQARHALAMFPSDSRSPSRAFALNAVGWYEALIGNYAPAAEACTEALGLLVGTEHRFGHADALASMGYIRFRQGLHVEAADSYRRSIAILKSLGAKSAEAHGDLELGHVLLKMGDEAGARETWLRALSLFTDLGHERSVEVASLLAALPKATAES
jgi:DNA-binding SARP family transcriptional activator/Tfp pilus assembly protein PilF